MKTIKIGEKEYTFEYTFAAAEHKSLVQSMFNVMSGAYFMKGDNVEDETLAVKAMVDGSGEMVADLPHIAIVGFYAGLLEHNPVSEDEAKELMKKYMIENKKSYRGVFEDMKEMMREDGFFDLSGLNEIIEEMNQSTEEVIKPVKTPQDHKKKQTSKKSSETTE